MDKITGRFVEMIEMKENLLGAIHRIIDLLSLCNIDDKAEWLMRREEKIRNSEPGSEEFRQTLLELRNILAGMGSLSDLVLIPRPGSGLTEKAAEDRRKELENDLWQAVEAFKKTT